jgi:hypothetical protein
VFLAAEDDLPTFKGWTSSCTAPIVDQTTPPSPCAPVTINACNNTRDPSIPDVPNLQPGPWYNVSRLFSNSDPPPPQYSPVSGFVDAPDPYGIAFTTAVVTATTSNTVVFRNKVGLRMEHPVVCVVPAVPSGCGRSNCRTDVSSWC